MADKARVEVRIDPELQEAARALAEKAGVSMNQLLEGVLAWAIPRARVGEPVIDESGEVAWRRKAGAVVSFVEDDEEHESRPTVFFVLDFRPSRSVRERKEFGE